MLMEAGVLSARRLKEIASLKRRKMRTQLGQTFVEGPRGIEAAVYGGAAVQELLVANSILESGKYAAEIAEWGLPVFGVPDKQCARISDVATGQGIVATIQISSVPEERLVKARRLLLLDAVQDPGNVGALIRSAAWFGVDGVIAGIGSADPFSPKVVRASTGGVWGVQVAESKDLVESVRRWRERKFACYGADQRGEEIVRWKPKQPSCLVVGNEGAGISADVRSALDMLVSVGGSSRPSPVESLNAAVAGGLIMARWVGAV